MSSQRLSAPPASPLLRTESLQQTLQALVHIDSVNPDYGGPEGGEARVQAWLKSFLERRGLKPRFLDALPGRPNLTVTLPGEDPSRVVLFETHVDLVSARGMSVEPFGAEIREGRLWGRGSTDAKGQVTAMLHAFASIVESGMKPPVTLQLVFAVDEESGFGGVNALVKAYQAGREPRPAAAVIGEPTDLAVVIAHKGTQRWWVEVAGKSAHSAKPHLGVNAIRRAAALIEKIEGPYQQALKRRSHPLLGFPTVNVSKIEGGTQVNLVPSHARILLDRRTLPGESRESVLAEFETMFNELRAADEHFSARHDPPLLVDPFLETSPEEPIAKAACEISARVGRGGDPLGVPYGTDGSKLSEIGIPTIVVGPGSIDQAHTADEFIDLAELTAGAAYYHELMMAGPGE
jgi:acetylornithine deacetylase/succinyl-diaminopimelate desuccinylase-like protein